MTKKQFEKNFGHLRREVSKMLKKYEKAALRSGAFDLKAEEPLWGLPKDVLVAGLSDIAAEYTPHTTSPLSKASRKRIRNIRGLTYPNWSGSDA